MGNIIFKILTFIKNIIYDILYFIKNNILYILSISLFIFISFYLYYNKAEIIDNKILIYEIELSDLYIIISIIAFFIAGLWALHQFHKVTIKSQQEKAAEIAKLFANDILKKCSLLLKVIKHSELHPLFEIKDCTSIQDRYNKFNRFDQTEISDIYDRENIVVKYEEFLNSNDLQQLYLAVLDSRVNLKSFKDLIKTDKVTGISKCKVPYDDEAAHKLFILNNSTFPFKFYTLIYDVLNDLEHICMSISSKAAGSTFVYQSLHQIFLETVSALAVPIAFFNKNFHDKHYTNIIKVFNDWKKIRQKCLIIEQRNKEKAYMILNPKTKTV